MPRGKNDAPRKTALRASAWRSSTECAEPAQPEQCIQETPPAIKVEYIQEQVSAESDGDSETGHPKRKKVKHHALLSDAEEDSMVEWLAAHEELYNRKLRSYKDTTKKEALWRKKSKELGLEVETLKVWYKSLRTRFGRLRKGKSGQEDAELTERDRWILGSLDFLAPHIVEVRPRTVVRLREKVHVDMITQATSEVMQEEEAAAAVMPEVSDSTVPTTTAIGPATATTTVARDPLLGGTEDRAEQLVQMQRQVLSRMNTAGDQERDAFAEWLRSALNNLDHHIWRRCQQELNQVMYRYINENEASRAQHELHQQQHAPSQT